MLLQVNSSAKVLDNVGRGVLAVAAHERVVAVKSWFVGDRWNDLRLDEAGHSGCWLVVVR